MKTKIFLTAIAFAVITLTACTNKVDKALDSYEAFANDYVKLFQKLQNKEISQTDYLTEVAKLSVSAQVAAEDLAEINKGGKFTEKQLERYMDISAKYTKALMDAAKIENSSSADAINAAMDAASAAMELED